MMNVFIIGIEVVEDDVGIAAVTSCKDYDLKIIG